MRGLGVALLTLTALAVGLAPRRAFAQDQRKPDTQTQVASDGADKDAGQWLALPLVYYSPETLLAGGGVGIYYFRLPGSSPKSRPSNIKGDVIYTMREQFLLQTSPQIYLDNEKYFIDTELSFVRFFDRYWGIGNETPRSAQEEYTSDTFRGRVGFCRRLPPYANFGLRYHAEEITLLEWEPGKQIDRDTNLIGSRESLNTGFGLEFQFDSRDNYFSATRGSFVSAQAMVFTRTLGGTTTYLLYALDARKFIPTWRNQVLAFQAYYSSVTPGAPFTSMAQLGGINRMRGLFDGRYRDLVSLSAQAEYRIPIVWRLGVAGFAALGQVASTVTSFTLGGFHFAGGGGLRLMLVEQERLLLRFDVAWGSTTPSFYVTAHEAF